MQLNASHGQDTASVHFEHPRLVCEVLLTTLNDINQEKSRDISSSSKTHQDDG